MNWKVGSRVFLNSVKPRCMPEDLGERGDGEERARWESEGRGTHFTGLPLLSKAKLLSGTDQACVPPLGGGTENGGGLCP